MSTERQDGYEAAPTKDFMIAAMLSLFLGVFAIDRFYLARVGTGILKLITFGGFGIWYVIDLILILTGNMKDNFNQPLQNRKKNLKAALLITGVVALLSVALTSYGNHANPDLSRISASSSASHSANGSAPSNQIEEAGNGVSKGEENALRAARRYLQVSAFSESGLAQQLTFEGFSQSEANYGVSHSGADWNEQAARAAEQYLNVQSFSRSGLIEQLQFEGFTRSQAEYGARAAGY